MASAHPPHSYLKEPPQTSERKGSKGRSKRDQKDKMLLKLKSINTKLRSHLKELNNKLEVAIEKTQTVKVQRQMPTRETDPEEEQIRMETIRKAIENYRRMIERADSSKANPEELETKLAASKAKRAELEKQKHDLEVELEDFKDEQKLVQPVSDSELKIWDEKIRKKREIIDVEKELADKRKQKAENFKRENASLSQKIQKMDNVGAPKPTGNELKKLQTNVEQLKKEAKAVTKKNKEILREKENEVLKAKNEMNQLIDKLEEVNKKNRVSSHKATQNERIIKYGLYEVRGGSESQMNISYDSRMMNLRGSKSQYRKSNYQRDMVKSNRDRSAINPRNLNKSYHVGAKNLNSSIDSKTGKKIASKNRLNIKNKAAAAYGTTEVTEKKSGKVPKNPVSPAVKDVKPKQDQSESDNIKAHLKGNQPSPKSSEKKLADLKAPATGQRQKIETSVKLS